MIKPRPLDTKHGEGLVPGYELLDDMAEEMYYSPSHTLSPESAVRYIQHFGLECSPGHDGLHRLVCQEVLRSIEKAILYDGYILSKQ